MEMDDDVDGLGHQAKNPRRQGPTAAFAGGWGSCGDLGLNATLR